MPLHNIFYFTDEELEEDRESRQIEALLEATERHVIAVVVNSEHYDWWWQLLDEARVYDEEEADAFEMSCIDIGVDIPSLN